MAVNHSAVSSPWNQIVAAAATAAAPPPSPSPPPSAAVVHTSIVNSAPADDSDNAAGGQNVNTVKRQVWNKPSNAASSSVMGAESWPALSESARSPAKSPIESVKAVTDSATLPSLQGTGSMLPSPQRQVRENATANNVAPGPIHQKPFRRGNSNLSSNGGHPPQMSAPQGSMAVPPGPHSHNHTPKDNPPRAGFVPNDHQQHRNSFRNRNGGPHQRGDGSHHHNYGGRRDQDRANQDWNTHRRNFNGRDNYMSPRFVPQFIRPPTLSSPGQLYPPPPPPPIRSFGGSMGYPELAPPMLYVPPPPMESLRGVPFMPPPIPPNAMYFQPQDLQLHTKIVNQIDYYFSNENLIKDIYLRKNMDDQGWVPLHLIAGFKKVKQMTDNFQIVSDAVRTSSVVEMQGDKIRRWNDWKKWIMPSTQLANVAGSQNVGQLAEKFQSIALEATKNGATGGLDVSQIRPSSDSNNKYLISTSENTGQVGIQVSD